MGDSARPPKETYRRPKLKEKETFRRPSRLQKVTLFDETFQSSALQGFALLELTNYIEAVDCTSSFTIIL